MSIGTESGDPRAWYLRLVELTAQGPAYPLFTGERGAATTLAGVVIWLVWFFTLLWPLLLVAAPVAAAGWLWDRVV